MARLAVPWRSGLLARILGGTWYLLYVVGQVCGDQSQGAVFLREFTLVRRESLHEDFLSDLLNSHKTEDAVQCLFYLFLETQFIANSDLWWWLVLANLKRFGWYFLICEKQKEVER
ncbi:17-Beta-Hydroxysteroid Dehydrogenase 13 [Manis pentadactyla]|nr:17-Beta-Hydroxysteroid Dehydrogenase 13 [Manis pentadactyla]